MEAATAQHRGRVELRPGPSDRTDAIPREPLGPDGRRFLVALVLAAAAAALATLAAPAPATGDWLTCAAFAAAAAVAQRALIPTGGHQGFPVGVVFVTAAVLLLPPQLVVLVVVAQHLPDVAERRFAPSITLFNASNYVLDALAAWVAADLVRHTSIAPEPRFALAAAAAIVVFVLLNHLVLAVMLLLARGRSIRASGLLAPAGLLGDLALAGLGVVVARAWDVMPWLLPFAIAPLLLMQRSFALLARLGESERRFRALFEGAPVGTALLDTDGRIVSNNDALEQLLGYRAGELLGLALTDLRVDEIDEKADLMPELLAGRRDRYGVERRLRREDGATAYTQIEVALVRDAQRRPQFAVAMVEDLTERRQLEERLRHAQRLEAVGQLAGGIAHDFNNLLTIILGRTQFALRNIGPDDAAAGDLAEVEAAAERAAALTQQLLAFARRQVLQPRVLDVNGVVQGTTQMLRRLIGEDVELSVDLSGHAGYVQVDPGQLEQVIVNLAVNARDAMPDGGRLTIRTGRSLPFETPDGDAPSHGRYVTLAVSDTGTGMDAATQAHIFEPFFTTKEAGKGTGLGLATVHGIVGQSGGFLRVDSELGVGSTFTVHLPQVVGADEPEPDARDSGAGPGSETVLLVEDDPGVRTVAERFLREAGYTVLVAADGADGLKLAELHDGRVDLLVTDLVMPGLGGVELADAVMRLRPGIRVLFVSGYSEEPPTPGAEQFQLVSKPFTAEKLLEATRVVLDAAAPIRLDT